MAIFRSEDFLLNSKNDYIVNCISRVTVMEGAMERKAREKMEEEQEKADEESW